jgi:hypothetical protein
MARRCGTAMTICRNCCAAKVGLSSARLPARASLPSTPATRLMASSVAPCRAMTAARCGKRADSATISRCSAMACGDSAARRMIAASRCINSWRSAPSTNVTPAGGRNRAMMRWTTAPNQKAPQRHPLATRPRYAPAPCSHDAIIVRGRSKSSADRSSRRCKPAAARSNRDCQRSRRGRDARDRRW